MFKAGEIVLVTRGALAGQRLALLDSPFSNCLIVAGRDIDDVIIYGVNAQTGRNINDTSPHAATIISKVDHLKDAFFEEDRAVVNLLKKMLKEYRTLGTPFVLLSIHHILRNIGYEEPADRSRIITEFLE